MELENGAVPLFPGEGPDETDASSTVSGPGDAMPGSPEWVEWEAANGIATEEDVKNAYARLAEEQEKETKRQETSRKLREAAAHVKAEKAARAAKFENMLASELGEPNRSPTPEEVWAEFDKEIEKIRATGVPDEPPDEYKVMVAERYLYRRADEEARQRLQDEQLAAARGPRHKRTAREYALVERPAEIMKRVLAAEVNLLGGPSEAGKSLLARDWAMAIAAGVPWCEYPVGQARNVLWIASEGTHDFEERWQTHPLWDRAADRVFVLDETVNLLSQGDIEWLLAEYEDERPGLVVFDVIYGMGMSDDNGVKDVNPVIAAMKKISAQWGAATLALGHPPLGDPPPRRFRGSSMWRQLAYTEWHLGAGRLTCEKSKLADKTTLGKSYMTQYPHLQWLTPGQVIGNAAEQNSQRVQLVEQDIEAYPDDNDSQRAKRLAPIMGVGERTVKRVIEIVRKGE